VYDGFDVDGLLVQPMDGFGLELNTRCGSGELPHPFRVAAQLTGAQIRKYTIKT